MKKPVLFLFVLLAGLTTCEKNVFKVDVRINNADSTTLYLQKFENEKPVNIDSAILINGSTILKAPLGDPQMVPAARRARTSDAVISSIAVTSSRFRSFHCIRRLPGRPPGRPDRSATGPGQPGQAP